jgi:pimeloyl-ACP methyl ester carboxylesterase
VALPGDPVLYLHGFASSPASRKAVAFRTHAEAAGLAIECLDCRQPSMEQLSLEAIVAHAQRALGRVTRPAWVVGSSLGGLAALHLALRDHRVRGLMLLAPAFELVSRWRARLGPDAWDAWQRTGYIAVDDHALRRQSRVHHAFVEELDAMERARGERSATVPTTIVHGIADDVVPVGGSVAYAARSGARLVQVDDDHELGASLDLILAEWDALRARS